MTRRRWLLLLLTLALGLWLASGALAGTVRCTTYEITILDRLETTCDDGTRAVSYWNSLLQRWETSVTQTPRPGQTCTTRMHPVTKHLEIRCP